MGSAAAVLVNPRPAGPLVGQGYLHSKANVAFQAGVDL